ncbi:GTP cyclohydrolase I FolE2 [Paenibacillus athensensis]|uniref:GTP cyclohydrolase FolE2 n=1 Tax=Paenibacillus athensensis TaxID=1967502 RepID=A0A4Y8QBH9_9BACL|nr:GTP cyclohydrolase FolE2 [Paenibacillus athensensis]MCD1257683.1 GTP cyclohydrolase I FolE2 [Paenibacillus athensensis]
MNDKPIINLPSKIERHKRFGSVDPIQGTKPTTKAEMADLQNTPHDYLFQLDSVGICQVQHPITVYSDIEPIEQTTVASLQLTTSLHREAKGINMSRLTEQLEVYRQEGWSTELATLAKFTKELAVRMNQDKAEIKLSFPWFYETASPVMNLKGLNHAQATVQMTYQQGQLFTNVGLQVAVATLCPCSKEISEYSAHNQRGIVTISVELHADFEGDWKVLLLSAAESNASSALFPILKRPDEKAVTEKAYENPRFVEDMVRLVAADLYEMDSVRSFTVECRNEESIHLHDAIARVSYTKA